MPERVNRLTVIPAGTLVVATTGEDDEYRLVGVFRTKVVVDVTHVAQAFTQETRLERDDAPQQFIAWLGAQATLMKPMPAWQWHLGGNTVEDWIRDE